MLCWGSCEGALLSFAVERVYALFISPPPHFCNERPAWVQLSREELNVLRHCKSTLNKLLGRMRLCRKVRTRNNHMVITWSPTAMLFEQQ